MKNFSNAHHDQQIVELYPKSKNSESEKEIKPMKLQDTTIGICKYLL